MIKTRIPINDDIFTLLMHSNIIDDFTQELNSELDIKLSNHDY